jgi:hypothetical protein
MLGAFALNRGEHVPFSRRLSASSERNEKH